ncbi:MAG: hypothetical protein JNK30_05345 [Phenylobacterium sp.]|uniref:DUF3617 domain-containing protein n=1 Tax=Phenylobacterium sp. TaxID=1871053 RepID=UPI001A3AD1EC|nr:DUF3617 family protein [Phenylobacterium sp.]MBL8770787.1 hypothetical protein [Phenylobacterium sp.]
MRRVAIAGTSLAIIAVGLASCGKKEEAAKTGDAAPAAQAAATPLTAPPKRKPGLWTHTIASSGVNQTMKVCLDEDTDAKMTVWGQAAGKEMCAKQTFTPAPGGWRFSSECDMGAAGKTVSNGSVTGDFNTSYVVKASSTTTGSSMPQANGAQEMTLTAKWEGPCPAGMQGGDVKVQIPGGPEMTINMEKMTAMAGGGQR